MTSVILTFLKQTMTEVDVFISNYTLVDPEIYQLWVDGHSGSETVSILNQRGLGQRTGASLDLIASDVLDHYRTYYLLEKLLCNPHKLHEQLAFQIDPITKQLLIDKYYDVDDIVIRELLGKKLTAKHRKDLDEISEKTGIPLKSCRRQFDNLKRIFKTVEDLPGSVEQNIQNLFYLPEEIARKYACIVFLSCMRFEITKKRVQYLSFDCVKQCTEVIMKYWTLIGPDTNDTEIDKDFLAEMREFKVIGDREREHKHLVCQLLKPIFLQKTLNELEQNFRIYTRLILGVAINLTRGKDQKCLFVELLQAADTFKSINWCLNDLEKFFAYYTQCALEIDIMRDSPYKNTWEKYMKVFTECVLILYKI